MKLCGKFFLAIFALSLLSYGISGAAYAAVEPLSVTTNKEFYAEGGTITISGFVKNFDASDPQKSMDVSITIWAPNGNLATIAQVSPSSDGSYSTTEAAMILDSAEKIIIVPGYGLAVAKAQHVAREVADTLKAQGKKVLYGIHPVAGRMPGHMNVLLAEADVSYDLLKDLDEINPEFEDCDVALILGANDVVNPAARHDQSSPIYGMPILNVDKSRTVIINKRSMNPGFAGIQNELFGYDNSIMVFGDAKDMLNDLLKEIKELYL